ncbi:MAG: circularly permuted type 2 ATP-grasp protein [Acidobacteriota bacterium]|nr:circularly permuted type 2 ATP-grasp protein [Acidobacteriota bacterium]
MTVELYHPPLEEQDAYDEMSSAEGACRPHWAALMEAMDELGPEELGQRWARAERRIRENGITYNIYGDPQGVNRPWKIDMIPLLLPAGEWQSIEAGIVQRAQLLSQIVADMYGRQTLLASGNLPAELLFANPAFLRSLVGVPVPTQSYLHMIGVDLARSPDGQWWVLSDRTQAPSGSGYALENRTIVSNVMPDLFRDSNVMRLAPFFRAQREALLSLAGTHSPRIVLLTPGPHNETYFEHSYIARYLGFTLVEGADLTVRDRTVFLKTVEGLERVDVILRRVDDSFCDPLELRGDSLLGVPGLVDAIVAGNVRVANALGSGVIESAAIMPFLPGLCQLLRGESLKLPSVATWWCGQPYALEWVLQNLESLVVKPAFPSRAMEPVFGSDLSPEERERFAARLRAAPYDYVAQEQVALSRGPVWEHGSIASRSLVLRVYAVNTGNGWTVMPGGLARVASKDNSVVSMQRGGHSKDVWVLSDSPVDTFTMLRPKNKQIELRHDKPCIPSSVAHNLYWLGRYVERAEDTTRVLRTVVWRVPRAGRDELDCLLALFQTLGIEGGKLPKSRKALTLPQRFEQELLSVLTDGSRADSLPFTLGQIHQTGGKVRDRLSTDMTHLLGKLRDVLPTTPEETLMAYPPILSNCMELLSGFSGMERENIVRGQDWIFLSLGRRVERALFNTRLLRELARPFAEKDWPLLELLLEVADSSVTYRSRYFTTLQPLPVMDMLMADQSNPRSLDFQLAHIVHHYRKLPRHLPEDLQAMQHALERLRSFDMRKVSYPLPDALQTARSSSGILRLRRLLDETEELLLTWSDNLSSRYFNHARTLAINIGQ